jgi:hypothetical protein
MKALRVVLPILLAAVTFSPIDYDRALTLRVEEVVSRFHSTVRYRQIGKGWFEFTDTLSGLTTRYLVADAHTLTGLKPKKYISINVPSIDTAGFAGMFSKVATVPIGTAYGAAIGLMGLDGDSYLIGAMMQNSSYVGTYAFRKVAQSDSFVQHYLYSDERFVPIDPGTFKETRLPQLAGDNSGKLYLYDTPDTMSIPTTRFAFGDGSSAMRSYPRLFDLDGDGYDEIVSQQWPGGPVITVISKFVIRMSGLKEVYRCAFDGSMAWGSWSVGDFDLDRKGEIATVTMGGHVFFIESGSNDSTYSITFVDTTRGQNAGFNCEGNDLDRDGRPECFLGSLALGSWINIAQYETIGDDNYEVSLWLELTGIGALQNGILTGDVDGDGRDELIAYMGGVVLILKSTGNDTYEPLWMKIFPSELSVRVFDVDGDGAQELLIGQVTLGSPASGFTEMYRYLRPTSSDVASKAPSVVPYQIVYPNPASETLMAAISDLSHNECCIQLLSSQGMIVQQKSVAPVAGKPYVVAFAVGRLPEGVYFIRAASGTWQNVRKVVIVH